VSIPSFDASGLTPADAKTRRLNFLKALGAAMRSAGYPSSAHPDTIGYPTVTAILTVLVTLVAMVYAPIAAALVDEAYGV
jgi:hypothetical protein